MREVRENKAFNYNVQKEVHMFHLKQLFEFEQLITKLKSQRRSGLK